jgi:hypothetical protein
VRRINWGFVGPWFAYIALFAGVLFALWRWWGG